MWEVDAGWKLRCAMAGCAIMAMPIWSYGARAVCHRRASRDEAVREEFLVLYIQRRCILYTTVRVSVVGIPTQLRNSYSE